MTTQERKMTPTVTLVRHGDTRFNKGQTDTERFRSVADLPLNASGVQTAREIANKLAGSQIAAIHTSDLRRAVDTAKMIADASGAVVHPDIRFRPWHIGHMIGHPVETGKDTLNHYVIHPHEVIDGGESFKEFCERFFTGLDEIFRQAQEAGEHHVIVSHSRNQQLTKASYATPGQFTDHDIDNDVYTDYTHEIPPGHTMVMKYLNGKWQLMGPSDTSKIVKEVYWNALMKKVPLLTEE